MSAYDIDPGVAAAVAAFELPERLGFGRTNAPVMFAAEWRDGAWQRGRLLPYGPIELWPGSRALQYAELVFEGLKAYRVGQSRPNLFRPDANCRRMMRSAERLSMPPVPEALFFQGITAVTHACSDIMPTQSGPLALPAAVPVRHGEQLHAAQLQHFPLHGHREPGRVLCLERDAGHDRARRGACGGRRDRRGQGRRQLCRSASRFHHRGGCRPHHRLVARWPGASVPAGALGNEPVRGAGWRAAYAG